MQVSEEMLRAATIAVYAVSAKAIEPALGIKVCAFDELPERDRKLHEDYARAALEAALAAMWQDISTAPKDGRRIMAYCDKIDPPIFQTQWHAWTGSWEGGGEWVDIWNNDPIETNDGPVWPSHWAPELPLPQPPRHKEG